MKVKLELSRMVTEVYEIEVSQHDAKSDDLANRAVMRLLGHFHSRSSYAPIETLYGEWELTGCEPVIKMGIPVVTSDLIPKDLVGLNLDGLSKVMKDSIVKDRPIKAKGKK